MEIIKSFPPNYEVLKSVFNPPNDTLFCFKDKLYNPSGIDIPEDVLFHEEVHSKQQEKWDITEWWNKYIKDPKFRLEVELEAFALQYRLVKRVYPAKEAKMCLEELAEGLAKRYNLNLTVSKAETLIRKYDK